ncbi:MAG: hypothetical protein ABJH52_08180 [Henriciella sp.]
MIRTVSSIAVATLAASAFASAAADTPAATVANPVMVSVERNGEPLDISSGTPLQSGDTITLSNNTEIVVNNGIVTFGDASCALTSGVAYTLDLGAGVAAKQGGVADVCSSLLQGTPIQQAAIAASGEAVAQAGGAAAGAGNAPLIIGGIVVAAGGIAAAAGGGGGDDTPAPTSP